MAVKNEVEEVSEKQFESFISKNIVVIDFFAEWCMPCLIMAPVIEEMKDKFKKIKFGKVNIDENSKLSEKFKVMSIPCLIIFDNGKEVGRILGSLPSEVLEEKLRKFI